MRRSGFRRRRFCGACIGVAGQENKNHKGRCEGNQQKQDQSLDVAECPAMAGMSLRRHEMNLICRPLTHFVALRNKVAPLRFHMPPAIRSRSTEHAVSRGKTRRLFPCAPLLTISDFRRYPLKRPRRSNAARRIRRGPRARLQQTPARASSRLLRRVVMRLRREAVVGRAWMPSNRLSSPASRLANSDFGKRFA